MKIVCDREQRIAMIGVWFVVRRNVVGRIVGQKREPVVQLPGIEQFRFVEQEIFNFRTQIVEFNISRNHHAALSIMSRQRRQNTRRWPSSVLACEPVFAMPRERSFHSTSRHAA